MPDSTPAEGSHDPATGATSRTGMQDPRKQAPALSMAEIQEAFRAEVAPLRDEIAHLKNQLAASRRVLGKSKPPASEAGDDGEQEGEPVAFDPKTVSDPKLRSHMERQDRELRALQEERRKRIELESKSRCKGRLVELVRGAKIATGKEDFLVDHLLPHVREDDSGEAIYDNGARVRRLDEVVREYAAQDMFRPAAGKAGAGAARETTAPVTTVHEEDLSSQIPAELPPAERLKMYRRLQSSSKK